MIFADSDILQHRMALHFSARAEGLTLTDIIKQICGTIA
jgi:hypothetical protein